MRIGKLITESFFKKIRRMRILGARIFVSFLAGNFENSGLQEPKKLIFIQVAQIF